MTGSSYIPKQGLDVVRKKPFCLTLFCATCITRELHEKEQKGIRPATAHIYCLGERCSDHCNYYEKTLDLWEGSCFTQTLDFTSEQGCSFTEKGVTFGAMVRPERYQPPMTAQRRLKASQ